MVGSAGELRLQGKFRCVAGENGRVVAGDKGLMRIFLKKWKRKAAVERYACVTLRGGRG